MAHRGERVKEGLEHACLAQPPEALPNGIEFPNASGRARQVMLWTAKSCTASRRIRSFRPLPPRRERQARNTSSTVAQSSSVIRVSTARLLKSTCQVSQIHELGNPLTADS